MTLGYVQREMRALHDRVKLLESAGMLTEAQISAIAKRYADRAFRRLVVWALLAAFAGGGLVLLLR